MTRRSEDLGFKELTADNWRDDDRMSAQFARPDPNAGFVAMSGTDWARVILARRLDEFAVPLDVLRAFEVARGCMLYGWFFYPLYRLGEEEAFRVLEGASTHAYKLLGGPEPVPRSYAKRIAWLIDAGAISAADEQRWDAARQLRNTASHRYEHVAMTPGGALSMVESVAEDIDALFTRVRELTQSVPDQPDLAPTGPWWVSGAPATFATSRERAWKEAVGSHVAPAPATTAQTGLAIEFAIARAQHAVHAQDLDNLAEPVLSAVVNGAGWFGKNRSSLRWLALRKTHSSPHGCRITPLHEPPLWLSANAPMLDDVYHGPRPSSAGSIELAAWVAERHAPAGPSARYALRLGFGDRPNLGDIATGVVKPIIDCLWPQLGGTAAAPEDWRVDTLVVVRGCDNVPPMSISVSLWVS